VPAVRLLTPSNLHNDEDEEDTDDIAIVDPAFRFSRKKWNGFNLTRTSVPKEIKSRFGLRNINNEESTTETFMEEATLSGYAPAGRLDIDSTGIIIFTRAGIMARRLIAPDSKIPKEYIVKVSAAVQPTARERESGLLSLPPPNKNLRPLLRGGHVLWNDTKPLKRLLEAEWMESDTLRLVLQEGKKRQIRRMCREILGMHVVSLVRTSIGPVKLGNLPEGKWRPLRKVIIWQC
jgi:23S rRNA pseudouridine2604 synthase